MLHRCAQQISAERGGRFPKTHKELCTLPGIGPYTAGAILAFAHNLPYPVVETNIRTVILHFFFPRKRSVADSEVLEHVEMLLDRDNPGHWYAAIMDYGTMLKASGVQNNNQSAHYKKQSRFKGSLRQVRGAIVRELSQHGELSRQALRQRFDSIKFDEAVSSLIRDELIQVSRARVSLPSQRS